MDAERETVKLTGCLLQADVRYPKEKILECAFCLNRSSDVGDLAKLCKYSPKK